MKKYTINEVAKLHNISKKPYFIMRKKRFLNQHLLIRKICIDIILQINFPN